MAEDTAREPILTQSRRAISDSDINGQNPKEIVEAGYDGIAQQYLDFAMRKPTHRLEWTDKLIAAIPQKSSILELGCGGGLPVTKYLLERGFVVTANDISQAQVNIAQREAPGADYVVGDMTGLSFPPNTFDGVLMFFSLFHIPIEDQQKVLSKIHLWLKPGGHLVLSVGAEGETNHNPDWMGQPMFWANAGTEGTIEMIEEAKLEVVESEVRPEEELKGDEDWDKGVRFLWVLARRK